MHMTPMSYIYVLVDPTSLVPRYVGKTSRTLDRRLRDHVQDAKKGGKSHRANLISVHTRSTAVILVMYKLRESE